MKNPSKTVAASTWELLLQVDTLVDAHVFQKHSGCNSSDAQQEGGCHITNSQTFSGHPMSDCEPENGCQDTEVQIQNGYLLSDSEDEVRRHLTFAISLAEHPS